MKPDERKLIEELAEAIIAPVASLHTRITALGENDEAIVTTLEHIVALLDKIVAHLEKTRTTGIL